MNGVVGNLSNNLPHDVMLDVLSRLPAKTLARFRCVAQPWNSLVRDQVFGNMNFNCVRKQHTSFEDRFILTDDSDNVYSSDYQHPDRVLKMKVPISGSGFRIWGSCNGLVCVQCGLSLYLWNPSTIEYRKTPPFSSSHMSVYGFGYNHAADDYEVVHINRRSPTEVSVYSLRKNLWTKKSDIPYSFIWNAPGELVSGSLHWVVSNDKSPLSLTILAFEIGGEKPIEIPMPRIYYMEGNNLAHFQGRLCLLNANDLSDNYVDIWVMNDYGVMDSWTKQLKFAKSIHGYHLDDFYLCLTEDGVIVMRGLNDSLILHDLKDGSRRLIHCARKMLEVRTYSVTLVSFPLTMSSNSTDDTVMLYSNH